MSAEHPWYFNKSTRGASEHDDQVLSFLGETIRSLGSISRAALRDKYTILTMLGLLAVSTPAACYILNPTFFTKVNPTVYSRHRSFSSSTNQTDYLGGVLRVKKYHNVNGVSTNTTCLLGMPLNHTVFKDGQQIDLTPAEKAHVCD